MKYIKSINNVISYLVAIVVVLNLFAFGLFFNSILPQNEIDVRANGVPTSSITIVDQPYLGEDFEFTINFSNSSPVDAGYGPFVNLYLPSNGADGNSGSQTPDGVTFNSASYLGAGLTAMEFVFGDDDGAGPLTVGCVDHPFAKNPDNSPVEICGEAGDTLVVLMLPFGSFTPGQPTAEIIVSANLSNLADLNVPLTIEAEAGFYLGGDALNNPSTDPSVIELTQSSVILNSQLILVEKVTNSGEGETVTGPNFVREFEVSARIADGQNIDNFVFVDDFPNDLVYQGITSISSGCTVISEPIQTAPTNNAQIIVDCGTVVGGSIVDFTYNFYGADIDADGVDVISHTSGGSKTSINEVVATGQWNPTDTRDGQLVSINSTPAISQLELKSNTIQKSMFVSTDVGGPGLTPGDTITYNISGSISDYFAFQNLVISDFLSDGQRITSSLPNVTYNFGGTSSSGPINPTNLNIIDHYTGSANPIAPIDGTTEIIMDLSSELNSRGLGNQMIGGCVNQGINASPNPDCNQLNNGATTFNVTFTSTVLDMYSDNFPSGESSLNSRDTVSNSIVQNADLLDNTNTNNTLGSVNSDSSATSMFITATVINKNIYAVNGVLGVPAEIMPGDEVTYRISVDLPSSDGENLVIADFLPLPTFDVNELSNSIGVYSGSVPVAGTSSFGPNDTLFAINGLFPTITKNTVSNEISYTYGTFNDVLNRSSTAEILFTVTVSDRPSADELKLTNQAQLTDSSTNGSFSVASQIIQIELRSPEIRMNKGIVGALNPDAVFSPSQVAPTGVSFNQPNTTGCQSFTGTIGSDKLATNGIDSDISGGVDGGDIVRYAVTIENTGGSDAFDISLSDNLPAGMQIPTTGANLCITRGDGSVLSYSSINVGNTNPFFEDGIIINDTQSTPALRPRLNNLVDNTTNGQNILVITYDLEIANNIPLDSTLTNRTNITSYASVDGGFNHAGDMFDTASLDIFETPAITKNVTSINYPGVNNSQVVIGSIVNYQSVITLDEGFLPGVRVLDTLDNGLGFRNINSITYSSSDISSTIPIPTVISNINASNSNFTLDFGNITNINTDNNTAETITIDYSAVVLNIGANVRGGGRNNNVRVEFRDADNNILNQSAQASNVIIREPTLQVVKDISPIGGDTNDLFTVTLDVSHTTASNSNAFEIALTDVLPAGMNFVGPILNPSGIAPTSFSNTGNTINVNYNSLALGQTSRITFVVQLGLNVSPNQLLTNTANINWTSLSGDVSTTQTIYSPSATERNYTANGSDTVRINNIAINKAIVDTNINHLDVNGNPATTGNNIAIGEHLQYEVVMNIPEGTTNSLVLADLLDSGLVFVGIDSINASPSLSTSIVGGFNGVVSNATYSGTARTLTLDFGTVTNLDTTNANTETIVIRYTVAASNSAPSNNGSLLNNRANINWGTGSLSANAPNITIVEPNLTINKTANTLQADNQDIVEYTIQITNNGTASAFDTNFVDVIPSGINYNPGSIVVTSINGNTPNVSSLPNIDVLFDQINVNETVTIIYQAIVGNSITPSQIITNNANISWSSMLGDQFSNSSSTIINSARERTGNTANFGGVLNDYRANATASFSVPPVLVNKTIASTSENDSTVNGNGVQNVHIGEIVRYRLVSTIPESAMTGLNIVDNLPDGMEFINDGSANIAFVANNLMGSSNYVGGHEPLGDNNTVPVFSIPSSTISVTAGDVSFALGNVLNSDNDNGNNEYIIIEYNAIVRNIQSNQNGSDLPNSFSFNFGINSYTSTVSNVNRVNVVEPEISTAKTLIQTPNDQGDLVVYRIDIANSGTGYGYNVNVTDLIDAGIGIQSVSGSGFFLNNTSGQLVDVVIPEMSPSSTFSINIIGILNNASTGQNINNVANTIYESLSDDSKNTNPTGSTNTNPNGASNGPRNGTINANSTDLNNYFSADNVDFTVNLATIQKLTPTKTNYAIGEFVDYDILLNVPEGVSLNTRITDQVPNGLIYDSHSIITNQASTALLSQSFAGTIPLNNVTGGALSGDDINIELGNISTSGDNNGLNNSFVVRVRFLINNEIANQNGVIFSNTANLLIDTNEGDLITTSDTTGNIQIIEPELEIQKTVDDSTPTFDQEIEYTLTINHTINSTSNAYDIVLTDLIPSEVDYVVGSSVLQAGWSVDESDLSNIVFEANQIDLLQTSIVRFKATVKSSSQLPINQSIINTASIQYSSILGADINERDGSDTITGLNNYTDSDSVSATVSSPDLVISKDDGSGISAPGDLIEYQISVGNIGNNTSNNVVITETVPDYTTFDLANSTAGWNCPNNAIAGTICEFDISSLDPNDVELIVFAVNVNNSVPSGVQNIYNQVSVSDDLTGGIEPNFANNSDDDDNILEASPDLVVTKTDNETVVYPGDILVYTINVSNDGNQTADNVIITENLQPFTSHIVTSTPSNWNCTLAPVCTLAIGSLNALETRTYQFSVQIDDTLEVGIDQLVNTISITDDGLNGVDSNLNNNEYTDTDQIIASPELEISKTPQQLDFETGDTINYQVFYSNNGNQDAQNVVIRETVPLNTTFNLAGSTSGFDCPDNSPQNTICLFNIPLLASGQSGVIVFSVTINNTLEAGVETISNTIRISDDETNGIDPDLNNNVFLADVNILAEPDLVVTKTDALTDIAPGQTTTYQINVSNQGDQEATGVIVTDTIPTNVTYISSNDPNSNSGILSTGVLSFAPINILAGQSFVFTVTVQVNLPALSGQTTVENTASAFDDRTNGIDPTPSNNIDNDINNLVATPDLEITKTDRGITLEPGQTIIYDIEFTNVGNQNASNIIITETLPSYTTFDSLNSSLGWVCGLNSCVYELSELNVSDSFIIQFAVTVDSALQTLVENINNIVEIEDDGLNGADPTPENNIDNEITSIFATPNLAITKTDNLNITTPGQNITYEIEVSNTGNQEATGVIVTENIPAGSTFDNANSTAGWVCGINTCNFNIASIPSGDVVLIDFAVIVDSPLASGIDILDNDISVIDDGNNGPEESLLDNVFNDQTIIDASPDIKITKDDGLLSVNAGDQITYTLTIENVGNQNATGVVVTDTLPQYFTYTGNDGVENNGIISFPAFNIAVGEVVTINVPVSVDIDPNVPAGLEDVANSANAFDDGNNGADIDQSNNTSQDTNLVNAIPDLSITKTDNLDVVNPSDTMNYQLVITNTGNQASSNVVITETVPDNTSFNNASSSPSWLCSNGGIAGDTCLYNIPLINAGQTINLQFSVDVDDNVFIEEIQNTVSVNDDGIGGIDPTPENNSDSDTTETLGDVDLRVQKTNDFENIEPGQTVQYTITVNNDGNIVSNNVNLVDTLDSNTQYISSMDSEGNPGYFNTTNSQVTFDLFSIDPMEQKIFTITVQVIDIIPAGIDEVINDITVEDDTLNGPDINPLNNQASHTDNLIATPDLEINISTDQLLITPNEEFKLDFTYTNLGNQDATGVIITEILPQFTILSQKSLDLGWECEGGGLENYIEGVKCTYFVGDLAVNEVGEISKYLILVDQSQLDPNIPIVIDQVEIRDDGQNGTETTLINNYDNVSIKIPFADLEIEKTVDKQISQKDDILTYKFVFRNKGIDDATDVIMTDILPDDLEFIDASRGGEIIQVEKDEQKLTLYIGDLTAGAEDFLLIRTKVRNDIDVDILNEVSIKANEADPEISNNNSNATTKNQKIIIPEEKPGLNQILSRTGGQISISYIIFTIIILAITIFAGIKIYKKR